MDSDERSMIMSWTSEMYLCLPQVASAIVGLQMCASAVAWLISAVLVVEHVHTLYAVGLALTKQRRARMSGAVCS
jgi:hypothetical protein